MLDFFIICPWCKNELILEDAEKMSARHICYCGAEPDDNNLTCTLYKNDEYSLFANTANGGYLTFVYHSGLYRIFLMDSQHNNEQICSKIVYNRISMIEGSKILKRYLKLKVFL